MQEHRAGVWQFFCETHIALYVCVGVYVYLDVGMPILGCLALTWMLIARVRLTGVSRLEEDGSSVARGGAMFLFPITYFVAVASHSFSPSFGWDAIHYWLPTSVSFLEAAPVAPLKQASQHPMTVSAIFAMFAMYGEVITGAGVKLAITFMVWVTYWGAVFGSARCCGVERPLAILLSTALTSLPLLENHFMIFGYADIYLATSVLMMSGLLCLYGHRTVTTPQLIVYGSCLCLVCAVVKDAGWIYGFSGGFVLLIAILHRHLQKMERRQVLFSFLLVTAFFGAAFWAAQQLFAVQSLSDGRYALELGRRTEVLVINDPQWVFQNYFQAFFSHQSFSILLVASGLMMWRYITSEGVLYAVCYVGVLVVLDLLIQSFTGFVRHGAVFDNTTHSRLLMSTIVPALSPILVICIGKSMSEAN